MTTIDPTPAPVSDDPVRFHERHFAREMGRVAFQAWAEWAGLHPDMLESPEGSARLQAFGLAYDRQVQILRDRARLAVTTLYDTDRAAGRLSNPEMLVWAEDEAIALLISLWCRIGVSAASARSPDAPPAEGAPAQ